MILLRCTSCDHSLEIDDAFAGGVCRCRYCGTIQTVPSNAQRATVSSAVGAGAAGVAAGGRSRTLYRADEEDIEHSGLDDLADVIASSGAFSSGLQRHNRRTKKQQTSHVADSGPDRRLMAAVGVAALLALVAASLAVALITREAQRPAAVAEPVTRDKLDFAGLPLGNRVVFLVDRGTQSQPSFAAANDAILRTLRRMPPSTQFQIVYWANPALESVEDQELVALPGPSLRDASIPNLQGVGERMQTVITGGTTEVEPALEVVLRNRPDTILLITGKAWQLSGSFADSVLGMIEASETRPTVHTLAVGDTSDGLGEPMRRIAHERGGEFTGLTTNGLRELQ